MKTTFNDINDLKNTIAQDPAMQAAFKNDPVEAFKNISEGPSPNDWWIYRIVVISLGASILIIISGVIFLTAGAGTAEAKIPTILTAIGSAAIGALSGLLAPSPNDKK